MQRQSNRYEKLSDHRYTLHIGGKIPVQATITVDIYDIIKVFNWSHRGRGIIKSDFNETLGSVVAFTYGYDADNWTRYSANDDYTASNFAARNEQVEREVEEPLSAEELHRIRQERFEKRCAKKYDPMGVLFMERAKYRTKNEYTTITVPRFDNISTIHITINLFLIQYVPVTLGLRNGVIICKDGTPLKVLLLEKLEIGINVRRFWASVSIQDEFDLRVDGTDLTFMSRNIDRVRYHFIDGEEDDESYVVVEVREDTRNNRFRWMPDVEAKWRIPYGHTINEPRVSYVIIDEDVYERADEIFWDDRDQEWMVRDMAVEDSSKFTVKGFVKPTQLKRMVAEMSGLQINNVYVQPEVNSRYELAMNCTAGLDTKEGRTAARRRYKYENHSSVDKGQRMYKDARHVKRRHVVADKQYFCTSIYGGVGVWCFDMRKQSVRLRGIQAPEQDKALLPMLPLIPLADSVE